jgi:hypothetical protein
MFLRSHYLAAEIASLTGQGTGSGSANGAALGSFCRLVSMLSNFRPRYGPGSRSERRVASRNGFLKIL